MENFVSDPGMIDTKSFKIFFIISVNEAVSQSTATLWKAKLEIGKTMKDTKHYCKWVEAKRREQNRQHNTG